MTILLSSNPKGTTKLLPTDPKTCSVCNIPKQRRDFPMYKTGPKAGQVSNNKCKPCYATYVREKNKSPEPRGARTIITKELIDKFIHHYTIEGLSVNQIRKLYRCAPITINNHLREAGIKIKPNEEWRQASPYTPEERKEIEREKRRTRKKKIPVVKLRLTRKEAKKRRTDRARIYVKDILTKSSCVDCGYSNWLALEFDHREPDKKYRDIGKILKGGTISVLIKEIEKCDVVCRNCHAIRTAAMFGSWRLT